MAQRLNVYQKTAISPAAKSRAIEALQQDMDRAEQRAERHGVTATRISGLYGHNPKQNLLLAALPMADYERLQPHLELVHMELGMNVDDSALQMQYVYFPTSCIVSILIDTKEGVSSETAVIGQEGLLGITMLMGGGSMLNRMVVKSSGYAFRLKVSHFREEFKRGGALQAYLLRYMQALLTQMSQTALCNRHHTVVQQLCRLLLLSLDRLPTNEVNMTQELIAQMLGVRRESITDAACKLQEEGLINYRRGHILVKNRAALEARVCECYACVKSEYDRLMPANEAEAA